MMDKQLQDLEVSSHLQPVRCQSYKSFISDGGAGHGADDDGGGGGRTALPGGLHGCPGDGRAGG